MLIDRLLSRTVVLGALVTLLALLGVGFFFTFLSQVHNVGTGTFTVATAFEYAALTLPQNAYDMFPMAVLIGTLFALGGLAAHDELMMLRVAGAGVWRLALGVSGAGLVLALLVVGLGEFVAPPAKRIAETVRIEKMYSLFNTVGPGGLWIKTGHDIVHVLKVESTRRLSGLVIYTRGPGGKLQSIRKAASARYMAGRWVLHNVVGTRFAPGRTEHIERPAEPWPGFVAPSTFRVLVVDPENLSWRGLLRYLHYLRANGLAAQRYEIAFWHKIAVPVSVLLMVLLALPFSLGRARDSGVGQRLALGVGLGLAYYLVDRILLDAGAAFHLAPLLAAWSPTLLIALVVGIALRRAGRF